MDTKILFFRLCHCEERSNLVYKLHYWIASSYLLAMTLNCVNEFHDGIAVFLRQFPEFLHRTAGIALRIAVPHNGLDNGLGAAVVQTVAATRADG